MRGATPMNLDPKGYYALLDVRPDATQADIAAAYRRQARLLHPDVPKTGNSDDFIAVKQAYDVLSDPDRRLAYDRSARKAALDAIEPEELGIPMAPDLVEPPMRRPRLSDLPIPVWLGFGLVIAVCAYQLTVRMSGPAPVTVSIPATAPGAGPPTAAIQPATPVPQQPPILAGVPNHYTVPTQGQATVWRVEADTNRLVVIGQLHPFTPVQAVRLFRQPGLMEIRLSDTENGLIQAARLNAGNQVAARRAFCTYHAGVSPRAGEVLRQRGSGSGILALHNRSAGPAVVKLRDRAGSTTATIYLGPGEETRVGGLPDGTYRAEYGFGEVWSRTCNGFAVSAQAWRMPSFRSLAALTPLVIPPDAASAEQPSELPDQAFNQD